MNEAEMEQQLISTLTHGEQQWVYRKDVKSVPQLWDNFFKILSANNKAKLADVPLTENEKQIIRTQITKSNFYKAAEFMVGANRQVRFNLKRDDSTLADADLLILNNTHITGGTSVYEVVNQIEMPATLSLDRDRRFDVTLLINGLPIIHIELKSMHNPYKQAFRQIQKYINEGKFTDIFSFVEMFVVTNGTNTRYIAANQSLNEKYLSSWVDKDNQLVDNYLDFAHEVLSIPAAHHMIADYTVLDSESKNIILLRPYQVNAIKAIREASREGKSGFVWHTTGSGKTLTSYKVARDLLRIPIIDKTIFLIDRKELDIQTTGAFQTYASNDTISINETKNSYDLADQLIDGNSTVIVTTRQKLRTIFKRIEDNAVAIKKYKKLKDLKLAFIVDECHRTVTPTQKRELDSFFNKPALWYGFTGTPIFDENARAEKGNEARTTEQLYGPVLHKYTIQDALRDNSVLGFQTNNLGGSDEDVDGSDSKRLDKEYLSDKHMHEVIKKVFQLAYRKQGLNNKNKYRYAAIFTTSSIKQAQRYYSMFKEFIAQGGVPKRITEVAPDFPRMAVTYSVLENEAESEANQDKMKQALVDYNTMFGTSFSMSELGAYNRNVNERLAGKKNQFKVPGQQLDIVIVVDRLLTGFDAPRLSTLYIDRPPMNSQNIIQAFSRTNRLYDNLKTSGQIITFQYPKQFSEAIDNALRLYSYGGSNDILAPVWRVARKRYIDSRNKIERYMKSDATESILDAPVKDRKDFVKAFQNFDKNMAAIQTYDELDNQENLPEEERLNLSEFSPERMEELQGVYENVIETLRKESPDDPTDDLGIDDEYELESFYIKNIDVDYITSLIQAYVPDSADQTAIMNDADRQEIDDYIDNLAQNNKQLAEALRSLWKEIQENPSRYKGQQVSQILNAMLDEEQEDILVKFANEHQLDLDKLRYVMSHFEVGVKQQKGMRDLTDRGAYSHFKQVHSGSKLPNPLEWKKSLKEDIETMYVKEIQPLEER